MKHELTRRAVIEGGLLAGAAALLAGCQSAGTTGHLPGPLWPDQPHPTSPVKPKPGQTSEISAGVIPRSQWAGGPVNMKLVNPMNGISRITIHHDAISTANMGTSMAAAARRLEGIRQEHMHRKDEPFGDIGYHYIIDPSGRIWAGRPLDIQGAHVAKQNEHNLGIMCMGNFMQQSPTAAQLTTLDSFVMSQMRRYNIRVGQLFTHRELGQSDCPGTNLQRYMVSARTRGGVFVSA